MRSVPSKEQHRTFNIEWYISERESYSVTSCIMPNIVNTRTHSHKHIHTHPPIHTHTHKHSHTHTHTYTKTITHKHSHTHTHLPSINSFIKCTSSKPNPQLEKIGRRSFSWIRRSNIPIDACSWQKEDGAPRGYKIFVKYNENKCVEQLLKGM